MKVVREAIINDEILLQLLKAGYDSRQVITSELYEDDKQELSNLVNDLLDKKR